MKLAWETPRTLATLEDPSPQDWRWQLRNAARNLTDLDARLKLTEDEREGARRAEASGFPILITPYYLSLIEADNPACPLRRQVVPHVLESQAIPGDRVDPLGEQDHEVAPDLIQRYPDRALLFVTDRCAVYCRFCTRSRLVGGSGGARNPARLALAVQYLREHPAIREVILSGGDILAMSTSRILSVVEAIRGIPSVEVIRLASRVPVVLPQRITAELVDALRPHHPLWVMTHFNHPRELTDASRGACRRLADAGFPVMNQTVLLRGVNDDPLVLEQLFRGLIRERVRPYYLLQADPVRGSGHLRTPLHQGLEIVGQLQGRLSGIALPKFIVDAPGGMGKVPLVPEAIVAQSGGTTRLRTWRGVEVDYVDPPGALDTPSSLR